MLIMMRNRIVSCLIITIVLSHVLTNGSARGGIRGGRSKSKPPKPRTQDHSPSYPRQPASNPYHTQQAPNYQNPPAYNPGFQQPGQHSHQPPPYGFNVPNHQAPPPYGSNVPSHQAPPPYGFNVPGNQAPPPYSKYPPSHGQYPAGGAPPHGQYPAGGAPPYGQYPAGGAFPPSYGQYPAGGAFPSSYGQNQWYGNTPYTQYGNTKHKNKFFPSLGGMPIPIPIPLFINSGSSGRRYSHSSGSAAHSIETIEEGTDRNITCGGDSSSIQWTFPNGTNVPVSPINGELSPITSYVDINSKQGILTFHNATTHASGTYVCYINSPSGQQKGIVNVNVTPTKLKFSPQETDTITIKQNKEYALNCSGNVKSLTWFKDGEDVPTKDVYMLPTTTEGPTLTRQLKFEDMQAIHAGRYICTGFSIFNGAKVDRSVQIHFQEDTTLSTPTFSSPTHPTLSLQTVVLRANENFQINCKGDTKNVEWLAPPAYSRIDELSSTSELPMYAKRVHIKKVALIFNKVTLAQEGIYKCRVNETNESMENKFELKVIEPTSFRDTKSTYEINENDNVTIECVVSGRPKPVVNWYHAGKLFEQKQESKYKFEGDSLVLTNATYRDAGKYICKAQQPVERGLNIEKAFVLEIKHKPYFSETNKTIEKLFNSTGTIECDSIANPKAVYSWYRNDTTLMVNGNAAVNIEKNTIEMAFTNETVFGEYTCEASNVFGASKQYIMVVPMMLPYPPVIDIVRESKHNVTFKLVVPRNETISHFYIECAEESGKSWFYTNETKGASWDHEYTLRSLKENTNYVLRARSMNAVGLSEFSPGIAFVTSFAVNSSSSSFAVILLLIFSLYFRRSLE